MAAPRWTCEETDDCPVSRDRAEKVQAALFRKDILERYTGSQPESPSPVLLAAPASGLLITMAQCDDLALIAVSRDVRSLGLDLEKVRMDIPVEEMADGFLDVHSQWDLRITWSAEEKAWKFFQFWTSNEACAKAQPQSSRFAQPCRVRGFSPAAEYIAALAVEGGPEAAISYWDWNG